MMIGIIPAAGLGTRMSKLTRGPKELLPVWKRPMIDYAMEEAIIAGISRLFIVISPNKEEIKEHLTREWQSRPLRLNFIYQNRPLGLADAIYRCSYCLKYPMFAVLLPDNIFIGNSPLKRLIDVAGRYRKSVVSLIKVKETDAPYFGNCGGVEILPYEGRKGIFEITKLKDKKAGFFSTDGRHEVFKTFPRYLFTREFFEYTDRLRGKTTDELDDVPVLQEMAKEGRLLGVLVRGRGFDVGTPKGYRRAELSLRDRSLSVS